MSDNASVSMYAQRRLCSVDALDFPKHTPPPPCLPVFLRIDAWPLLRRPWAPQDAGMIKKKNTHQNLDSNQLHTGNSWKAREMSPPQSGTTRAIYHPYCWVGGSPEMELTLRKVRITYGVPAGVPRDQGPRRAR